MILRYQRLAQRIRDELTDINSEVARAQKSWEASLEADDPDAYIDSVALNLHGFYSGVERLFELIATQVDDSAPEGEAWHRQLIDQMAREIPETRPAVIDEFIAAALDEFRKFRHLVRNVYTIHLDSERMRLLVDVLPSLWEQLQKDLLKFADFLIELSKADEEE
ncbi:MAG: antitoxin [Chloroflexota bacterium]